MRLLPLKILIFLFLMCVVPLRVGSQIRSGAGFLKIQPGARESISNAGNSVGLNHVNGFFANPAITGFAREWQWSASYSTWIGDLYTTSVTGAHRIPTPWTQSLRGAIGVFYMGIPEFNSTGGVSQSVSGGDTRITAGLSQRIAIGNHSLAIGANGTFYHSQYAEYTAQTSSFDVGLLFRTQQFQPESKYLRWMHNGIWAAGAAITNIGPDLTFISEGTPLPRTVRLGTALYMGVHNGFQWTIAADYQRPVFEDNIWSLGSELSWNQFFALQFGYSFGENLLGNFSFGGSIMLTDMHLGNLLGYGQVLQLDAATDETNMMFNSPYYGTVSGYPNEPESFELLYPPYGVLLHTNDVVLKWKTSRDPDLFDELEYHIFVSTDSSDMHRIAKAVTQHQALTEQTFGAINTFAQKSHYVLNSIDAGNYFWTVLAVDRDGHQRIATQGNRSYGKFSVSKARPRIIAFDYQYSPWITADPYQGDVTLAIKNSGNRMAHDLVVNVSDSLVAYPDKHFVSSPGLSEMAFSVKLDSLAPDSIFQCTFSWNTDVLGNHALKAVVTPDTESLASNSCFQQIQCFTIPKGEFTTPDTVVVLRLNAVIYELPYVGKVYFDEHSSEIDPIYTTKWVMEPPLKTFAQRLRRYPHLKVVLQGTADSNSDENNVKIANERAEAVSTVLQVLGVSEHQISIKPGVVLVQRRVPNSPLDAKWIFEERRRVDITTDEQYEEQLFAPLESRYLERLSAPVIFKSSIKCSVPIASTSILWHCDAGTDSIDIAPWITPRNIITNIEWEADYSQEYIEQNWLNRYFDYTLLLTDSLNRKFRVPARHAFAENEMLQLERMYYVIAQFAQARPFYEFYWDNLLQRLPILVGDEKKRIKFIGHGCAIGSDAINSWLSEARADTFQTIFLNDIKNKYPELYETVLSRMDRAIGLGENDPIRFKTPQGVDVLLGDNNEPIGRQLNRRVMVFFYTIDAPEPVPAE
ncbi:PorV/PorQ family protein [candidate division KSB1 bacterium]|nr:PorV/PorQ family protein [candidate division KSB1 bacterium]